MEIVQRGSGEPLVLIPGLQGRWEYMRPTVDALSAHFRVVTFALSDQRRAGFRFDAARGLDAYVGQVVEVMDTLALPRAIVCGVSFGGIVALRCAARYASRTRALILVSTPGPEWHLRPRHDLYARLPWLFGPLFLAETPFRLRRELSAAFPDARDRRRFALVQLRTFAHAPISMARMAERARLIGAAGRADECTKVSVPTLIVHGDPALDHIVNVAGTCEYGRLIAGARVVALANAGHLAAITRPDAFATAARGFIDGTLGVSDAA
jgi:pimeloyl-ACP methyl ester carboxylesterase